MHWRTLEAAHLLEQNIERLSWSASKAKSARHQHSYSHSHSRMQPQGRCPWSPSPTRPRKHVTLEPRGRDISREGPSREPLGQAIGGEGEESDLSPLPTLEPELEHFLEAPKPMWGAWDRQGSPLQTSIKNCEVWLEWQAHQVSMPDWWRELVAIPNVGNPERLAHKICASFEVPWVR